MIVAFIFIFAILIGVPIALVLGLCGVTHMFVMDPSYLSAVGSKLFSSSNSLSMIAIPLFILAGNLMGMSGDVKRLCDFCRALLRHIKGGLCYVTIVLGALLGASLGSANAEAALLGSILYPELVEDGYGEEFSANLIGTVSIIGPIIPPGLPYIIYGVAAGCSIKDLFMAGIIPGLLIAASLSLVVFILGRNRPWPKGLRSSWREVVVAFRHAAFSLLTPLLTMVCIMTGVCTPTEAAAVLAILILFTGTFIYRKIKLKDLPQVFIEAAILSAACLMIGALGGLFGYTLALDQVPTLIANFIVGLSRNPYVVLLLINLLLLVVGCLMDAVPAIMILTPVLTPVIVQLGINQIHFGFIMCLNLTIGLLTPPVGSLLYTTAAATNLSADRMIRSIWPWIGVLFVVLMLVTYCPSLTTWLPSIL